MYLERARDVTIENLAIDASNNTVSDCTPSLATVHYYNSSGAVRNNVISGGRLANPLSCVQNLPLETVSAF